MTTLEMKNQAKGITYSELRKMLEDYAAHIHIEKWEENKHEEIEKTCVFNECTVYNPLKQNGTIVNNKKAFEAIRSYVRHGNYITVYSNVWAQVNGDYMLVQD